MISKKVLDKIKEILSEDEDEGKVSVKYDDSIRTIMIILNDIEYYRYQQLRKEIENC